MADRLLGVETEYAISCVQGQHLADSRRIVERLLDLARDHLTSVQDGCSTGLYLESGARLYIDTGLHIEFATPETTNPFDCVRYVEAGNRTIMNLIQMLVDESPLDLETLAFRVNVDYAGATWGTHESQLHSADSDRLPADLIPHLVSRLVYSGAGGYEPDSPGLKFTLSPRASFIEHTISPDSTEARAIYHEKDEPLCPEYDRLHILCGETLCSHLGMLVKFGATSLVVAMAEAGLNPGRAVQLESPIAALRIVAADLTLKRPLRLKGSGRMTAIQIQRHYLAMAEANLAQPFMPSWAREVCRHWGRALDLLETGAAAGVLDWPTKLELYAAHAARLGVNWTRLAFWNAILERLRQVNLWLPEDGSFDLESVVGAQAPGVVKTLESLLHRRGLQWDELRQVLALRPEFLELEFRFGQLGPRGIFTMLDDAGALDHRVSGIDGFEHAVYNPPATGRASLRGAAIKRVARDKQGCWSCNWSQLYSRKHARILDLSDPFQKEEIWRDWPAEEVSSPF
jgi:proteasome accessory factor A